MPLLYVALSQNWKTGEMLCLGKWTVIGKCTDALYVDDLMTVQKEDPIIMTYDMPYVFQR